eukprot:COSAG02_NODE_855_length_16487_cov_19.113498_11_plen_357_part_00
MQQMPRLWTDEAPSTLERPSSSRKSTVQELKPVCAQQVAEIDQLRAEVIQQRRTFTACEEELRAEVAAMQQIATERECSRLRLMNEMDEAVKIANLAVQEADDERLARERAEAELEAERQRNASAEQRLQREIESFRTPDLQSGCELTNLEKREADLAAGLAQLHLRETALEAQKDAVQRQRDALTQRQFEMRALITSHGQNFERSHTNLHEQEVEGEDEQETDLALLRMRSLEAHVQWREERVHARELDVEQREAAVFQIEGDLRSSATKLRQFAHEQSRGSLSPSFQHSPSPVHGHDGLDEIERQEAHLKRNAMLLKREESLQRRELELLQLAEMQRGDLPNSSTFCVDPPFSS